MHPSAGPLGSGEIMFDCVNRFCRTVKSVAKDFWLTFWFGESYALSQTPYYAGKSLYFRGVTKSLGESWIAVEVRLPAGLLMGRQMVLTEIRVLRLHEKTHRNILDSLRDKGMIGEFVSSPAFRDAMETPLERSPLDPSFAIDGPQVRKIRG